MCRGSVKEKASLLFDTIIGLEKVRTGDASVSWKSGRMTNAFKKLMFFSEIFPKKYAY